MEQPWAGKLGELTHELHYVLGGDGSLGADCDQVSGAGAGEGELCRAAQRAAHLQEVLVTVGQARSHASLGLLLRTLKEAGTRNVLLVAMDAESAALAEREGVAYWRPPPEAASACAAEAKWRAAAALLQLGFHTLLMDPETVVFRDPFRHLYRDADAEVASNGWDDISAYGYDDVVDDPSMGWSR